MALYQPSRIEVLDDLVAEVLHLYPRGRVLVGLDADPRVDWFDFAEALAARFRKAGRDAVAADIEGFARLVPAEDGLPDFADLRERSEVLAAAADDYYTSGYDYALLRRALIEPFRLGGSTGFNTAVVDRLANRQIVDPNWITMDEDAVLIVAGPYLLREELAGLWHWSAWLEYDGDESPETPRSAEDLVRQHLLDGMQHYRRHRDPRKLAKATVDLTHPDTPARRYADSC